VPRICKAALICTRCGTPLRRKSSVPDQDDRWYCGLACRRKQVRDDQKHTRRLRREAVQAMAAPRETIQSNPEKEPGPCARESKNGCVA
jgi:hypothetical protein